MIKVYSIHKGIILVLTFTLISFIQLSSIHAESLEYNLFTNISRELLYLQDTKEFNGKEVIINSQKVDKKRKLITTHALELSKEMTALTNEILTSQGSFDFQTNYRKYPQLKWYFNLAKKFSGKELPVAKALVGSPVSESLSRVICGWFPNPKPGRAKDTYTFSNVSDPEGVLRSWGYHPTINTPLGNPGWTRARIWNPGFCGWNTYRDNANPNVSKKLIYEQNYAGWTPNGEPNPEIWASGPWPYPDWPTYVIWWHATF